MNSTAVTGPAVITGAAQKTITNPAMSGCRMRAYRPRWVKGGGR